MEVPAASAAMMMVGHLPLPRHSWSADSDILRIRNYSDILTLDPAFIKSKNEDIINGCIQYRYNLSKQAKMARAAWMLIRGASPMPTNA